MLVSIEDIGKTELYPEIIGQIIRDDADSAEIQIMAAESLVKSYMRKYDLDAIFGTADIEPTHPDELVKKLVKVIATWYIVKLANANVNLELFRIAYEDAIAWLDDLKNGLVDPVLPYLPTEAGENNPGTGVNYYSNIKRSNSF
ncbi:MAG: hypothetical protein PHZ24_09030 [Bacteroidales bacterium]|nr:hypothetical protein [Bacteroidales bacterium]